MQRGITYYGSGARLRAVAHKLLQGRRVKVYTLGGSVTASAALHPRGLSYAALLFRFINGTFPNRMQILEPFNSPSRRAFEQLIRRLLALPGRPAVMLLHHYAWWMSKGDGLWGGLFYKEPEAQHTTFAHYYDLPSVSLRAAAWRLMEAGVEGFKVDKLLRPGGLNGATKKPIPVADEGESNLYLYGDVGHPEVNGQQALAELLTAPLTRAVREAAAGLTLATRVDDRLGELPPPMIPKNPVGAASVCAMLEDFKKVVTHRSGFQFVAHRPDAPTFALQKWRWQGNRPGDWVEMEVNTVAEGAHRRALATVMLVHLRSYENMGLARVECVEGCACPPAALDTLWRIKASIFYAFAHKVTQHPRCRLRVTIEDEPGRAQQQAHKVSLTGLMVTH
ncbi:hypothetical protein C2E20_3417 [Micractinium conductrix]|uniref:Uncharacterized protein n=1 Tax=Micractinium conductrix TaxID=554055 RepID=A0A2P6VH47_9CHLO|nr:hypothetical protein C2E20_3417 [Micractinium conductrix]|eukprot:PSC73416.1 hypothetical protein C2E20_3417 [Micractinium conductrix]